MFLLSPKGRAVTDRAYSSGNVAFRDRMLDAALMAQGRGTATRLGDVQQLEKVVFPECGAVVGLVAAGFVAKRNENVAAALHALDLAIQDAQFRRVDFIIGRID